LPLTLVADREADVYETFGRCRPAPPTAAGPAAPRRVPRAVARLGGFLARAREPGWQTIWRAWQRLLTTSEGYALAPAGR
jgi:hypothetical protein